jgi:hypothetical protein
MQTFHEVETDTTPKVPWNKGKLLGSKPPLQTKEVWAIRTKLQGRTADARPCDALT